MNHTHHYTRQQSPPPFTSKTHNDTSLSSDANSSHHSSPGGGSGNRSRSFSITDILAENTGGRKRSITSESNQEKVARMDMMISPGVTTGSSNQSHLLPLMQAGNVIMSPVNACLPVSPAGMCQSNGAPFQNQVAGYYHPLSMVNATNTPSYYPTFTPVTPQHIRAPPTTHLYTSLLPPNNTTSNTASSGGCSQLQENMADMKIASHLNESSGHESMGGNSSLGEESTDNVGVVSVAQNRSVKKKVIAYQQQQDDIELHPSTAPIETTPDATTRRPQAAYLPNYFQWSPLQLGPHHTATFSPSIFLTRPPPPTAHVTAMTATRTSPQDHISSPEENEGGSNGGNQFMTSTPIRRGSEKIYLVSPSRVQQHSPISNDHQQQRNNNSVSKGDTTGMTSYEYTSGSDSEIPLLHRPRVPPTRRRPPRARTSLNPLLESTNTNIILPPTRPPLPLPPPPSQPSSAHPPPPSTLLTSYKLQQGNAVGSYPSFSDSGIVSDSPATMAPLYRSANYPLMDMSLQQHQYIHKTPVKGKFERGGVPGYAKMCGSSPVTDHLNKTGQIQSVPPWFVCSDKKSDGKRLRLTEAINRSLSDGTNQKQYQLPAEWQKLAYGQTEDQKTLTRKARNFLKGRPRVLKFDNTPTATTTANDNNNSGIDNNKDY